MDRALDFSRFFMMMIAAITFSALVAGCSLNEIRSQFKAVEDLGRLEGSVIVEGGQEGDVIVYDFIDVNGVPTLIRETRVAENGSYVLRTEPGAHYLAAFLDANGDGQYQTSETGGVHSITSPVLLKRNDTVRIAPILLEGPLAPRNTGIKIIDARYPIYRNIGRQTSLDDPRFSQKNYALGLWRPLDFLTTAQGGLFFLHEYSKGKIPVLFVHGAGGGPKNWADCIAALDSTQFQPWVLYYPSGIHMNLISSFMVGAVHRLQLAHGFDRLFVVAHSMGGIAARTFVREYSSKYPSETATLGLVVTVNSPLLGVPMAGVGVKHSPIVMPVWRDIAPGSDFMRALVKWDWPADLPYNMVVSFQQGSSSDGVIPLASQAPLKLQSEAEHVYIFQQQHASILKSPEFHHLLNQMLAAHMP